MVDNTSSKYETRRMFWHDLRTDTDYAFASIIDKLAASDEINNQIERCKPEYIGSLAERILIGLHSSGKEIDRNYEKNLSVIVSALNNYDDVGSCMDMDRDTLDSILSNTCSPEISETFIRFISDPDVTRCNNKLNIHSDNFFYTPSYLDFRNNLSVLAYKNFLLAKESFINKKDEDGADKLSEVNEVVYSIFGPEKAAGIFSYLMRRRDKNSIRKLNSIVSSSYNEISEFISKIKVCEFGVKKAERLINLAYFLGIAMGNRVNVLPNEDLNISYTKVLKTIKNYFFKKYSVNDITKIERLPYWLEELDDKIAPIFSGAKIYKKGPTKSYILNRRKALTLHLSPSDLETQMESLQNINSCLSPGGVNIIYTKKYLLNPSVFWAVIKSNGKIVGRATIAICKRAIEKKTSAVHDLVGYHIKPGYALCRLSEIRSDVEVSGKTFNAALRKYAKEMKMKYIKDGLVFINKLDSIYDDFIESEITTYRKGVIAELNMYH